MELSYQELVRLTMVYMLSSDPLIYTNALNLIRENVGTNEGIINQERDIVTGKQIGRAHV